MDGQEAHLSVILRRKIFELAGKRPPRERQLLDNSLICRKVHTKRPHRTRIAWVSTFLYPKRLKRASLSHQQGQRQIKCLLLTHRSVWNSPSWTISRIHCGQIILLVSKITSKNSLSSLIDSLLYRNLVTKGDGYLLCLHLLVWQAFRPLCTHGKLLVLQYFEWGLVWDTWIN